MRFENSSVPKECSSLIVREQLAASQCVVSHYCTSKLLTIPCCITTYYPSHLPVLYGVLTFERMHFVHVDDGCSSQCVMRTKDVICMVYVVDPRDHIRDMGRK